MWQWGLVVLGAEDGGDDRRGSDDWSGWAVDGTVEHESGDSRVGGDGS